MSKLYTLSIYVIIFFIYFIQLYIIQTDVDSLCAYVSTFKKEFSKNKSDSLKFSSY